MYLSCLVLNPANRQVRRDFTNCRELHRTLLRAFPLFSPGGQARQDSGLLYRLENECRYGRIIVYAQSKLKPEWNNIPKGYCMEIKGPKYVKPIYESLKEEQILSFSLRANPTRKIETAQKIERLRGVRKNGRRVFIKDYAEQIAWLQRKGKDGGFELLSVSIDEGTPDLMINPKGKVSGYHGNGEQKQLLTFGSILYKGNLRISDSKLFMQTLVSGIGSGKAYGFGLLSLASPRRC